MKIEYSRRFIKQYRKLDGKLQERFVQRLELWERDASQPALHVHRLQGKFQGFYSFNVSGDVRALYKIVNKQLVLFEFIGTHSELYGR